MKNFENMTAKNIYNAEKKWKEFNYSKGLDALIEKDKTGRWIYHAGLDWEQFDYNKGLNALKGTKYYNKALSDWPKGLKDTKKEIERLKNTSVELKSKKLKLKEDTKMLNESFKFEKLNKESAITKNYNQAKVFLKSGDIKEKISKLKAGEDIPSEEKKNLLTALHIARKVSINKRLKDETREEASNFLKNAGIDLNDMKEDGRKLMIKSRQVFENRFKESKEDLPKDSSLEKTKEDSKEEKIRVAKPKIKSDIEEPKETEEEPEDVEDTEEEPEDVEDTEYEAPDYKKPDKVFDPNETSNEIQQMREKTADYIEKVLSRVKGKKEKEARVRNVLKRFQNKLERLEKKAQAGPKNARDAYNSAVSSSRIAKIDAENVLAKDVVGRTIQTAGEVAKSGIKGAKELAKRTGEAIDKNEQLRKIGQTYSKVKERVKSAAEKGVERIGEKISKVQEQRNYSLILKELGKVEADKYRENPEKNTEILSRAISERNKKAETMIRKGARTVAQTPKKLARNVARKVTGNIQQGSIKRI
jgi:uncharacterized membrane protein